MKKAIENLAKLINVKTIVTMLVMIVFTVLALTDKIPSEDVMYITVSVISFYFGTQHEKRGKEENGDIN